MLQRISVTSAQSKSAVLNLRLQRLLEALCCGLSECQSLAKKIVDEEGSFTCGQSVDQSVLEKMEKDMYSMALLSPRDATFCICLRTSADGNCLFNSVSILLCGDERLAAELRTRTAVELSAYSEEYEDLLEPFSSVEEMDIAEVIRRCAQPGSSASVGEILGLSRVIGRPISSFYPSVPSVSEEEIRVLNFTALPRTSVHNPDATVRIMWTRTGEEGGRWLPNHFVPIIPTSTSVCRRIPSESSDEDVTLQYPLVGHSVDLDADSSEDSHDDVRKSCESSAAETPATNQYMRMEELLNRVTTGEVKLCLPPADNDFPTGTYFTDKSRKEVECDGGSWKFIGKKVMFRTNTDAVQHFKGRFVRKVRQGRSYEDKEVGANENVFEIMTFYYKSRTWETLSKRVTVINGVQPACRSYPVTVEYLSSKNSNIALAPPHGNSKDRNASFHPTAPEALQAAKEQLKLGLRPREVYNHVPELRNMKQVRNLAYNMKRQKVLVQGREYHPTDPWLQVLCKKQNPDMFIRHFMSFDGEPALFMYTERMIEQMSELVRKEGAAIHIDTTYLKCCYMTYIAFDNSRVQHRLTGRSPLFVGPFLLHQKEKDSTAISHFLFQVKVLLPTINCIITDECRILSRWILHHWPNTVHLLGKEHLIANFRDQARKHGVALDDSEKLKSDIFGPPRHCNSVPLLDSQSEEEFEKRWSIIMKGHTNQVTTEFLKWIEVSQCNGLFTR